MVQKSGETKARGPLGGCVRAAALLHPLLICSAVNSCAQAVPYSYIIQKPGLEYFLLARQQYLAAALDSFRAGWLTPLLTTLVAVKLLFGTVSGSNCQ